MKINVKLSRCLSLLPAKYAHDLAPLLLKLSSFYSKPHIKKWSSFQWKDLHFPNPLGIAGGVDKNAFNVNDWWKFGVGFIEVGTVTPKPQTANPPPYIIRDSAHKILWNKLGFPNKGAKVVKKRLAQLQSPYLTPIFLNIGKNRETKEACADYIFLIQTFHCIVDGFVINISSPNTQGLRQLLSPHKLKNFLTPITEVSKELSSYLFLKLSPDMDLNDFFYALDLGMEIGLQGFILTNTTLDRPSASCYPKDGGISGSFLSAKSLKMLKLAHQHLKQKAKSRKEYLLISVGGVMTAQDVFQRLECGADLVQVYTALVFESPYFFHQVGKIAQNLGRP